MKLIVCVSCFHFSSQMYHPWSCIEAPGNGNGRNDSLPRSKVGEEKMETISKNPPPPLPPQLLTRERTVVKPMPVPTTRQNISRNTDLPKSFSISSLQQYTNSFSQENLIGRGMVGTVYRAKLPNGEVTHF